MALWNENTDLIQGDKLNLYLTSGKTVVAYGTNASLQIETEAVSTSSKFSCRWQSSKGGKSNYTINCDSLYCTNSGSCVSFDDFMEMMIDGDQVEWYLGQEVKQPEGTACVDNPHTLDTGVTFYNGYAIVTSLSLEASMDEIATASITLTGAGEIQRNGAAID